MAITFRTNPFDHLYISDSDIVRMKDELRGLNSTTATSRNELNYFRDLCSNLKEENRVLKRQCESLELQLAKKTKEYDELLEEVREC